MTVDYSVDLISDLNLERGDAFDWSGKSTSLFCVVAGNISSDLPTVEKTLTHLGGLYRGVLYIDGSTEHPDPTQYANTIDDLTELCKPITNVIYMHNHVVVLNSIAFVGVNGWFGQGVHRSDFSTDMTVNAIHTDDVSYLSHTIRGLQLHQDAKKVVVISNSIPSEYFTYGGSDCNWNGIEPGLALSMDTENKVSHWLYGGNHIECDTVYSGRRYTNNPMCGRNPYWPKRIIL